MSIKIMSEVWEYSKQTGSGLLAMLALADWANDDGTCWYGQARLVKRARVKHRQINYILAKCEEDQEIVRARRGDQLTTVYAVICGVDKAEQERRIKLANEMPCIVQPGALPPVQPGALPPVQPTAQNPLVPDPSVNPAGGTPPKPAKEKKPRERDEMFDLICEICGLDPAVAPGSSVAKVKKELVAVNWTVAGLTAFRDYRKLKNLPPVGSVHWLQSEIAKKDWRNGGTTNERPAVTGTAPSKRKDYSDVS